MLCTTLTYYRLKSAANETANGLVVSDSGITPTLLLCWNTDSSIMQPRKRILKFLMAEATCVWNFFFFFYTWSLCIQVGSWCSVRIIYRILFSWRKRKIHLRATPTLSTTHVRIAFKMHVHKSFQAPSIGHITILLPPWTPAICVDIITTSSSFSWPSTTCVVAIICC